MEEFKVTIGDHVITVECNELHSVTIHYTGKKGEGGRTPINCNFSEFKGGGGGLHPDDPQLSGGGGCVNVPTPAGPIKNGRNKR